MYSPLIRAFNYAFDRLSAFQVPGLPEFQGKRQLVFARSATKCIESESYLQGSYKPDIILVKWNTFKGAHECKNAAYSQSYESNICCESGCDQPKLSWRNLLSTLEVKRGGLGGAGNHGKRSSKGKTKEQSVDSSYTAGFWDLKGDLEEKLSRAPQSAPFNMVEEENPTRTRMPISPLFIFAFSPASVGTRSGLRNRESSSSTSDRAPLSLQKRRRTLHESDGKLRKRPRSETSTTPGGTNEQEGETRGEMEVEEPRRPRKQAPKVQSAIYASHKISSSFDISHTINLLLIGTWVGYELDLH